MSSNRKKTVIRQIETDAVHGSEAGRPYPYRSVVPPVVMSSTFAFESLAALDAEVEKPLDGIVYSRWHNPTVRDAERRLALLETAGSPSNGGNEGVEGALFGAGIAAVADAVLAHVGHGERLAVFKDIYGGAVNLFTEMLPRFGIAVDWIETANYEALEAAITPETRAIYFESPTNPLLKVVDLERMASLGRKYGLPLIFDNTVPTAYLQKPLGWGVDVAVYSATKYLGGHSDLIVGAATGKRERMLALHRVRMVLGNVLDPHSAYLLSRSLTTLPVRMERHCDNAEQVLDWLKRHAAVSRVYYPGSHGTEQQALTKRQMRRPGALLSFEVRGGSAQADAVVERVQMIGFGGSLGGVESLITQPRYSTHRKMAQEGREALGITEGTVRLSVGLEHPEDIIADLEQALR